MESPEGLLRTAHELSRAYLDSLPSRPVALPVTAEELRASLRWPLSGRGVPGETVLLDLAAAVEHGLVATAGGRYFGFVIGGTLPVSIAADWLTSAWDQHGTFFVSSPAASVVEEVVAEWLIDLFGLPEHASCGLVTGCQMANFTALAAARHAVLAGAGWNVEQDGLRNSPEITVVAGAEAHVTIHSALRMLGLGANVLSVPVDPQGRMMTAALEAAVRDLSGPLIVCAQAGNVNSGAFDPIAEIASVVHERGGWLHVDGAFGLWARASSRYRDLAVGIDHADSWATDAHKWLNVPYDCGIVFTAHPAAHRAAMTLDASYLQKSEGAERDSLDWVPDVSRRSRAFVLYATLRTLGRDGVAELIEGCCDRAVELSRLIAHDDRLEVLNDVALNQVLITTRQADGGAAVKAMAAAIQREGEIWLGSTSWRGRAALRVSVSSWMTSADDIRRAADAISRAADAAGIPKSSLENTVVEVS